MQTADVVNNVFVHDSGPLALRFETGSNSNRILQIQRYSNISLLFYLHQMVMPAEFRQIQINMLSTFTTIFYLRHPNEEALLVETIGNPTTAKSLRVLQNIECRSIALWLSPQVLYWSRCAQINRLNQLILMHDWWIAACNDRPYMLTVYANASGILCRFAGDFIFSVLLFLLLVNLHCHSSCKLSACWDVYALW